MSPSPVVCGSGISPNPLSHEELLLQAVPSVSLVPSQPFRWDKRDSWDALNKNILTPAVRESYLDLSLLEHVRRRGDDVISACPACREAEKDSDRDNLRVFASGAFNCIAHPKDREHNRRIFELVGVRGEKIQEPIENRNWRERRARERQKERDVESLQETAKRHRAKIISRWEWDRADVWESSPQRIDCDLVEFDPRWFIASLFPVNATVWAGEVHESGQQGLYGSRWKSVPEWQNEQQVGPMITPAIWKTGTLSRAAGNIVASPYVVLDFDGLDGRKPKTADEIEAHLRASLALIRWIREGLHWELATILFTGSVSLHAWFHSPPPDVLESLKATATTLGVDAGLIGHPEHPCRLPGHRHVKTGKLSRVLWLQSPISHQPQHL